LRVGASRGNLSGVPRPLLLASILGMILLELNHLRWLWWENWNCRRCGVKYKDCEYGHRKWIMYL
jgi:hypothetical protein